MGHIPKKFRTGYGMGLSFVGLSRGFTVDLTEKWLSEFGDRPVTSDDLLDNPATAYDLLRAAGVPNPTSRGRTVEEIRRVKVWFNHFARNPLPTRDGRNDGRLLAAGERDGQPAWTLDIRATTGAFG